MSGLVLFPCDVDCSPKIKNDANEFVVKVDSVTVVDEVVDVELPVVVVDSVIAAVVAVVVDVEASLVSGVVPRSSL